MINVSNISFSYSQKKVINDLSFTMEKGDFCAVMGLNGSGKSTLLKLMLKLLPLEKGKIEIDGKDIREYSTKVMAQKIAYVPQRQDMIFDFSVYDVVMMGRNPYQNRWESENAQDRQIVDSVLKWCNLEHLRDRMFTQLSGGESQRALIARAMAQEAPIMLLDEPLANLDIVHKFEILEILKRLNRSKMTTIVIVLHDFSFAMQYAAKTLLLNEGTLQHYGESSQILIPQIIKSAFNLSDQYHVDALGNVFLHS
ncbi:ABC transporter ATP-binding protein [Bacteroidales bacterium OttesenSCG-928-L19]|nr:ABC transporter ATP-binding protein [Bacteroidales bacterium OttesenSCG-928-L19]